jgi:hypothetical protein
MGSSRFPDVAPGVLAGLLGHALEEGTQDREAHVGVDAVGDPVGDRSQADPALELAPALLDRQELLVARKIRSTRAREQIARPPEDLPLEPAGQMVRYWTEWAHDQAEDGRSRKGEQR